MLVMGNHNSGRRMELGAEQRYLIMNTFLIDRNELFDLKLSVL